MSLRYYRTIPLTAMIISLDFIEFRYPKFIIPKSKTFYFYKITFGRFLHASYLSLTCSLIIRGQRSLHVVGRSSCSSRRAVSGHVATHYKTRGSNEWPAFIEGSRVRKTRNYTTPYVLPYTICIKFSSTVQTCPWQIITAHKWTVYSIVREVHDGILPPSHEMDDVFVTSTSFDKFEQ